ncbi:hypothetical protein Tco_1411044 [Tanacetum coccineum]
MGEGGGVRAGRGWGGGARGGEGRLGEGGGRTGWEGGEARAGVGEARARCGTEQARDGAGGGRGGQGECVREGCRMSVDRVGSHYEKGRRERGWGGLDWEAMGERCG